MAVGGRKERTCGGEVKGIGRGRERGKGTFRTRDNHWPWGPNWDDSRFCSHTHSVYSSLKKLLLLKQRGHDVLGFEARLMTQNNEPRHLMVPLTPSLPHLAIAMRLRKHSLLFPSPNGSDTDENEPPPPHSVRATRSG